MESSIRMIKPKKEDIVVINGNAIGRGYNTLKVLDYLLAYD